MRGRRTFQWPKSANLVNSGGQKCKITNIELNNVASCPKLSSNIIAVSQQTCGFSQMNTPYGTRLPYGNQKKGGPFTYGSFLWLPKTNITLKNTTLTKQNT